MSKVKRLLSSLLSCVLLLGIIGCWNYTEVDDMAIVAGVGIDKDQENGKMLLTAEMVDTKGGLEQNQPKFTMLSLSGDTMFSIVRNMISMTGKKLFWSHARTIILSEEIAREGLIKAIDWYSRDTETRSDVYIFVSAEKTARDILNLNKETEEIMSYELAQMMLDEKHTSSAPVVEIWDFIDKLETEGSHAIAPLIMIQEKNGKKSERVNGTAIFARDKMVGKLNGKETKSMLFAKNAIKGGVLVLDNKSGKPTYSLEIVSNKTKVKTKMVNGRLQIQIRTVTRTNLDEVMTTDDFSDTESKKILEKRASEALQNSILSVIQKVQKEYHADIFGFGEVVHEYMPKHWAQIKERWDEEFTNLDVKVSSKVVIESSAKTSRAIKVGD